MERPLHEKYVLRGVEEWNIWRSHNKIQKPELIGADLRNIDLTGINLKNAYLDYAKFNNSDLKWANLEGASANDACFDNANLYEVEMAGIRLINSSLIRANLVHSFFPDAKLIKANLQEADLSEAKFVHANLHGANLIDADLRSSIAWGVDFTQANLSRAMLSGASLSGAMFFETNLSGAILDNAYVYGVSVWDSNLEGASQKNLCISKDKEPEIFVDNIEVAQFVRLILNNQSIRNAIDTIGKKVVLILGRFLPETKLILDTIKDELRIRGYVPVIFDFEKPDSKSFIETVATLAHLSRFVIADFTESRIVLEEAYHIVRSLSVPFKPILSQKSHNEPITLSDLRVNQRSVLNTYYYKDREQIINDIDEEIIQPSERMAEKLILRKKPPKGAAVDTRQK